MNDLSLFDHDYGARYSVDRTNWALSPVRQSRSLKDFETVSGFLSEQCKSLVIDKLSYIVIIIL